MASPSRLPSVRRPAPAGGRSRPMSMFEVPQDHLKRLQQIGDGESNGCAEVSLQGTTSKQAKRRSLLPTFSRKESNDHVTGTIREDTSDSEVSSRPTTSEERRANMPPPPKPRPTSMRPPGTTIPGRTASTHARTTSRVVDGSSAKPAVGSSTSQRTDATHKRTGSTRLPQSPRVGGPMAAPSQQAIPARGSSTRATTSTVAQKRSSVVIARPPTLDTTAPPHGSSHSSPTSPTGSTSSRPGTRTHIPPPSRPAFSTHQQHYSPAKSALPKPPVPGARPLRQTAPTNTSTDSEVVITPEIALEQVELLQLSLLHQSSSKALAAYEASAKRKLGEQHARLSEEYNIIQASEHEYRRSHNLNAIESWCPDNALLTEHLQTLGRVVTDLRAHSEPGSRYFELADTFDKWAVRAEAILLNDREPASFIEALSETWRATHTSLALKLRAVQRDLAVLPPAPPSDKQGTPSSIEMILTHCSSLVDSMLRTLEVMTKLQKEVLQLGKLRIDEQINALVSSNDQSGDKDKENWVPAWQNVTCD